MFLNYNVSRLGFWSRNLLTINFLKPEPLEREPLEVERIDLELLEVERRFERALLEPAFPELERPALALFEP